MTPERWRQAVEEYLRRREAARELRADLDRRRRYAKTRSHEERLMPRRTQTAGTRARPQGNWTTREPARAECGCKRDGTWKCDRHFREHRAAQAARPEGETHVHH